MKHNNRANVQMKIALNMLYHARIKACWAFIFDFDTADQLPLYRLAYFEEDEREKKTINEITEIRYIIDS